MAYISKADGTREEIKEEDLKSIRLERAQKIVGGYVEAVYPRKTPDKIFLCNEDGFSKGLPDNAHASELYGGLIVGDVIVMTRSEARLAGWL